MKEFVLTQLPEEEVRLFELVRECVRALPDEIDLGSNEEGDPIELSCHILALAVARVFGLHFEDGFYISGFRHSWVRTRTGHIIDVYPVGMLGGPLMMDGLFFGLTNHLYRMHGSQPRGIRTHYHAELHTPHMRRAVTKVSRLLRNSKNKIAAS